ncbi:MAG: hypothetical protein QOE31_3557 [Solirubrobacteraceae bacterium]|jgi:ribosomal protein S18 acetylase RimI-like enzyme|nr:hypothetical protein [Solirubrobacteraceae bacterium]
MAAIAVRRARETDAPAIAHVHVLAWQAAYRGIVADAVLDGLSVVRREAIWREVLAAADGPSFTLVADREDAVAGFCSVIAPSRDDDADATTCEVAAIYVAPESWRRGVGRALLGAALHDAREDGRQQATLWVFAANHAARAFYQRLGFAPDGARMLDEHSGEQEIRMRAVLAAGTPQQAPAAADPTRGSTA